MVNVAGLAGTGKSILLQTAATCLSAGLPFVGRNATRGRAAYFGFEDPDSLLLHRQAKINELLGIGHPDGLYIKSYLGHDLTLFEAGQFTNRLPWLLAQIDSIEGLAAVFLDPGSDIYCDNFYDPVLVKRFCRTLNIEAFKRGITIFLGLHTAKGGEGNKTPFGSMQWLGATRATLVLDHVIGEDGRPTHEEAVLRVHKGNYMRPGDEIELVWQDGLLVPKDAPGGQDQLARLAELDTLIERLVTEAWEVSAPLSDNRSQGDRYLPARIRQASKGRFSHKEAKQQMDDHLRLGRLAISRCPGSRRIGLKVAETGGHNNQCVGGHRKD
jgi:RecA-family ATPase